ncbi:MAG TPA: dTDP-4-dehydrorhamnose reductase, partial [Gammaproteobacteria bacterium]|nr:dTDP-4-dehydrorhamnose reductase [Gammaproteobacteria bacterium]
QQIATATLQAVKSDQYVTAAARPKYSVLETNKLLRECKMRIPHWKIGLHQALTEETIR